MVDLRRQFDLLFWNDPEGKAEHEKQQSTLKGLRQSLHHSQVTAFEANRGQWIRLNQLRDDFVNRLEAVSSEEERMKLRKLMDEHELETYCYDEAEMTELAKAGIVEAISNGFLPMSVLAAVSETCKELLAEARKDHCWDRFLEPDQLGFALHDEVDTSRWVSPVIPKTDSNYLCDIEAMETMQIPFRLNGGKIPGMRYGMDCYLPHPDDSAVIGTGKDLVLRHRTSGPQPLPGNVRFDQETGILEDLFYVRPDDLLTASWACDWEEVWVRRPLPIPCDACSVTCTTYAELVQHCKQYSHNAKSKLHKCTPQERMRMRMLGEAGPGIPDDLVDPRHKTEYQTLSSFHKVKTLVEYRQMVFKKLTGMDETGLEGMRGLADWVAELVGQDIGHYGEAALQRCTPERVACYCMRNFAISDFINYGMSGYALDVFRNGYQNFELHGSNSSNMLFEAVVGSP